MIISVLADILIVSVFASLLICVVIIAVAELVVLVTDDVRAQRAARRRLRDENQALSIANERKTP